MHAIEAQRQLEEELKTQQQHRMSITSALTPSNSTKEESVKSNEKLSTSLFPDSDNRCHDRLNYRSDRNIAIDDSSILGNWPGQAKGMMESKIQYIRQMVFQYLSCKEADVKLHIESALMAIFRFNDQEKAAVDDRKKEENADALTSISNFLGTFTT